MIVALGMDTEASGHQRNTFLKNDGLQCHVTRISPLICQVYFRSMSWKKGNKRDHKSCACLEIVMIGAYSYYDTIPYTSQFHQKVKRLVEAQDNVMDEQMVMDNLEYQQSVLLIPWVFS